MHIQTPSRFRGVLGDFCFWRNQVSDYEKKRREVSIRFDKAGPEMGNMVDRIN